MRWWWPLLVVASTTTAHAEALEDPHVATTDSGPTLRLAHPGAQVVIDRAALALRIEERRITGTLTLALTATTSERDTPFLLDLPAGTRITGMTISQPKRPSLVARAADADQARADYQTIVDYRRDPALLRSVGTDRVELRVFPLGEYTPATVAISLVLPRISTLAIDPDDQLIRHLDVSIAGAPRTTWTDVHEPRTIALARTAVPIELAAVPRSLVTASTSLLAGTPVPRIIVDVAPPSPICRFGTGRTEIKRVIRDHHAQLRNCYERVLQRNPWIAGTAELAFTVEPDGRIAGARVGGDLDHPEVSACLLREMRSWSLTPDGQRTEVHYPLHFRSSEEPQ